MIALVACTAEIELPADLTGEAPIWELAVAQAPSPLPDRFKADLADPASWGSWSPGQALYAFTTDAALTARFLAALAAHPPEAPSPLEGLSPGEGPAFCAFVAAATEARPRDPWLPGLVRCGDPATQAVVERLDVSDDALANVYVAYRQQWTEPFAPRLEAIALRAAGIQDEALFFSALYAVSASVDPEAGRALLRLHGAVPRGLRDEVALSAWGRADPEIAGLHLEVCARVDDPRCYLSRPDELSPYAAFDRGQDLRVWFDAHPDHHRALLDSLVECALSEADPTNRRSCALLAARHGRDVPLDPDQRRVLDGTFAEALRDLGIPVEDRRVSPLDALAASGAAVRIPSTGGTGSAAVVLYGIAAAAGVDLHFDEIHPDPDWYVDGRTYVDTWLAWHGGRRIRGVSPTGYGYDWLRVAAFANAALSAAGSPRRAALDAGQQWIVVGEEALLRGLAEEELVAFAVPSPPVDPEAYDELPLEDSLP